MINNTNYLRWDRLNAKNLDQQLIDIGPAKQFFNNTDFPRQSSFPSQEICSKSLCPRGLCEKQQEFVAILATNPG